VLSAGGCVMACWFRNGRWLVGLGAGVLAFSGGAYAQEDVKDIDELVVSVRKTEENVQEVPIQVSLFDATIIQSENLRTIADVARLTPSLQFDTGFWPSDTRVSIRGLFNRAGRPSAAVLIDGIDAMSESFESTGGSALLNQRILDIERIEVARGPQSALYGRAAFAGAVNYVTKRPPEEWGLTVSGQQGERGRAELRANFGGPLIDDKLAFNVIGSHYELDGDYTNPNTGGEIGGGESSGLSVGLNWTPTDNFGAYLNTTYSQDEYNPASIVLVRANSFRILKDDGTYITDQTPNPINDPTTTACTNPPLGGNDSCLWLVEGNIKADGSQIDISPDPRTGEEYSGTDDTTFRTNLILDWAISDTLAFRSATSYTDANQKLNLDTTQSFSIPGPGESFGASAGNGSDAKNEFNYKQYYQEFQLNGIAGERINWLAGINGFWEDADDRNNSTFWYRDPSYFLCQPNFVVNKAAPCAFADSTTFDKTLNRDTTSYSVFGLFGWQFADKWKVTLEGRYIYDKVEVSADTADLAADILSFVPFNAAASYIYAGKPGFTDSVDDTNFVPRASLEYLATDTVMLYGSIANGIKPPTYNTTDLGDPEIARVLKEDLWTYELGAKSTLSDGRLLLNGAVFLNDYTDQQVRVQFPPPAGSFTPRSGTANAGETTVWGVEIDASWRPAERWLLNLSYAFTDGEYDNLVLQDAQPAAAPVSRNEQVKAGNAAADYSGNDTIGNPRNAATFLGRYQAPLSAQLDWYGQASVSYQGERYADIANLVELEAYTLVDAQIGLQADNWFVSLYAENLFDDDTIRYAQEFIDQSQGFQGTDPDSPPNTFTFPIAYFGYLPQPRTVGVRFSYSTN